MTRHGAPETFDVVVVGGGVAGFAVVRELRRRGFAGGIALVDPQGVPYDRPPLSKEFLTGDADARRLLLAPPTPCAPTTPRARPRRPRA